MTISTRVDSGVVIMSLRGSITIGSGDVSLREAFLQVLEEGHKKVVMDVKGVAFIDSAGLGELIRCKATAAARGATVKLLHVQERVRKVLLLTQLIGVFETFDDEGQALSSFA